MAVRIEFYGIPRDRAGVATADVQAASLGELIRAMVIQFPTFDGQLIAADRLLPAYVANINGERFVNDPQTPLADGDCVLILSADAGG